MTSQNTRVEQIRQWLAQITLEEARLRGERKILERTLKELAELFVEKQPTPASELTNRGKVIALLEAEGRSMNLTVVATRLWEAGLLTSPKGRSGVSATVSTVFQRGLGKVFERVGPGEYDLSSRVIKHIADAGSNGNGQHVANGHGGEDSEDDDKFTPEKIGVPVNLALRGRFS